MERITIVLPCILFFILVLVGCQNNQDAEERFIDARSLEYLRLGTEALERYEFGAAMAFADSAERYTPELPDASFLKGRIYSELEDFERAASAYELTMQRDSEYRGVWHNMGNNAYRMHEYDEAIQFYKKEIAQQSAPVPWRGIGRAYVELGQVDSARWAFEQAIRLDSLYAPAYFNLALLLEDEGIFEEALEASQTAWRLSPLDIDFRYLMASLLVSNQKFEQAIPHLQAVTKERPWHHASHYNLGQALVRAGDRGAGEEYLQKAEDLRAQDAQIKQLLNSSMTS
ncbi:MAG: tetratricopeptide repeat protein, partial [Rhodothermaceae bacterium]|nr:tetratricopeptide repeat protein [Rhodothermaceae bacterium]